MKRLALAWYLSAVWGFFMLLCIAPERALAVQYSRVVVLAAQQALVAANQPMVINAVATAAGAASPASVALRFLAGPIGWAALAITAGSAIQQIYYSSQDAAAVKAGASYEGDYDIQTTNGNTEYFPSSADPVPGPANPSWPEANLQKTAHGHCNTMDSWPTGHDWSVGPFKDTSAFFYQGPSFAGGNIIMSTIGAVGTAGYFFCHRTGQAGGYTPHNAAPTIDQIKTYLNNLPASDPKAIENHVQPGGVTNTLVDGATTTQAPVNADQVNSTVVPQPVPAGAAVLKADVPAPAGTSTNTTQQTQSTTTTTTTTNPDGSKTDQETSTTTVSCLGKEHNPNTLATLYEQHKATWQSSGLLQLITSLKYLTWPTVLPVISLQSVTFGTMQVDFNEWAGIFTAIRTLVIATTSFLAVRYIFAGGN